MLSDQSEKQVGEDHKLICEDRNITSGEEVANKDAPKDVGEDQNSIGQDVADEDAYASSLQVGQFYKTKICPWFPLGKCERGDACKFAHSELEQRKLPNLWRTSLCHSLVDGQPPCSDRNCRFAHSADELRATQDVYKTSMCYLWSRGKCTSGDACRHAHGHKEIRTVPSTSSHQRAKAPSKKDVASEKQNRRAGNSKGTKAEPKRKGYSKSVAVTAPVSKEQQLAEKPRKSPLLKKDSSRSERSCSISSPFPAPLSKSSLNAHATPWVPEIKPVTTDSTAASRSWDYLESSSSAPLGSPTIDSTASPEDDVGFLTDFETFPLTSAILEEECFSEDPDLLFNPLLEFADALLSGDVSETQREARLAEFLWQNDDDGCVSPKDNESAVLRSDHVDDLFLQPSESLVRPPGLGLKHVNKLTNSSE